MKLENEFTVEAPVEEAWKVLLDLERVTPCLPGASLQEASGEESYKGTMTVRLGPVSQKYNGTVGIEEADQEARRAVIRANGKDARGQGTASATITSTMHEEGGSTRVHVETDMHIMGKAAQFGRGMQQEVATKIIDQFAACLGREIMGENVREEPEATAAPSGNGASGDTAAAASATASATSSATQEEPVRRRIIQQDTEPEPLDLGEASREALIKRAVPVAVGLGVLAVLIWLLRR